MNKLKIFSFTLVFALIIGVLAGCAGGGAKDGGNGNKTGGELKDGVYSVEYDSFDDHGYKGRIELTVSGGKITDVKFDEIAENGSSKREDEEYKNRMEGVAGTYPEKAYEELEKNLIDKQSADIDTVSGATSSSNKFKALADYAIEMAKKGEPKSATIKAE